MKQGDNHKDVNPTASGDTAAGKARHETKSDLDKKANKSRHVIAAIRPGAVAESSMNDHSTTVSITKEDPLMLSPPTPVPAGSNPNRDQDHFSNYSDQGKGQEVHDIKKQTGNEVKSKTLCTLQEVKKDDIATNAPYTKNSPMGYTMETPPSSLNTDDVTSKVKHQLEEQIESQWQERLQQEVQAQLQSRQRQNKDIPIVQAISVTKEEDVSDNSTGGQPGYKWIVALVVIFLLTGGVVGVLVAVLSSDEAGGSPDTTNAPMVTTRPTNAPTSTPTVVSTKSDRQTYILERLGPYIAPTNSTEEWARFDDPISPQAQALNWMMDHDDYASEENLPTAKVPTLLERYALAVLYFSTSGDDWWLDFDFLNGNTSTCLWNNGGAIGRATTRGVLCQDEGDNEDGAIGMVSHLYLPQMHLEGTIPWEISLLQGLMVVDLEYNTLMGSLPSTLDALSLLTTLKLQENSLTGSLPTQLPTLIEVLRLTNNNLSGTLVGDWSSIMPHLIHMQLGLNHFQRSIPSEWDGRFEQLQQIDLEANGVTGTIPSALGLISTLRYLFFENNLLTGTLPTELGSLSDLNMFYIFGNTGLTGTVPEIFGNWSSLDLFLLDNTTLTGSIDSIFCSGAFGEDIPSIMADCLFDSFLEMECSCCELCCTPDAEICVVMNQRA